MSAGQSVRDRTRLLLRAWGALRFDLVMGRVGNVLNSRGIRWSSRVFDELFERVRDRWAV